MLTAAQFEKLMAIEDRMFRATDPQQYRDLELERYLILAGKDERPPTEATPRSDG